MQTCTSKPHIKERLTKNIIHLSVKWLKTCKSGVFLIYERNPDQMVQGQLKSSKVRFMEQIRNRLFFFRHWVSVTDRSLFRIFSSFCGNW